MAGDRTSAEEETISLDDIVNAPKESTDAPKGLAKKELDLLGAEAQKFKDELGWIGKPFGGRSEKPGNISALVIVFCFISMVIVYLKPPTAEYGVTFERLFGALTSIITLILGYLFGSNDRET